MIRKRKTVTEKETRPGQAVDLRMQAEKIARGKAVQSRENLETLSPGDMRQKLHDLRLHQIELEMQNEELVRVQAELEASRALYFDLYDLSPVGYCTLSEQGLILEVNLTATKLLGVARSTLLKQPISLFITKEDQHIFYRHRKQLFDIGVPQVCEIRMLRQDNGMSFWVRIEATRVQDGDGSQICRAALIDITEHKRVEEALRRSEENFRRSLEESPLGIRIVTEEGETIYANQAVLDIHGYDSIEELKATPVEKRYTPESYAEFQIRRDKRRQGIDAASEYTVKIIRKNGEGRHLHVFRKEVLWGAKRQFQVIYHDITDRKQAEDALWETQRILADFIEFLPDATLVIDSDGKVIAWNRAIESMTGVRSEEMLGKGNFEYALPFYGERMPILIDFALHPDPEREKAYTTIQRTGDLIIGEAYAPSLAPGNVHLSATASVLRDSMGEIVAAIECFRNNTDRKNMQERLQRAEKMEALGVLAGGVAHDMNNILGILVGYSELLLREFQDGSRAGKYAKSILQGSERASAIIQDLLTMARRGVSVSETVNLNLIVSNFLKSPEFELINLRHPDVLFRSEFETDLFNIKGSPVHLFKTIMNLMSNAAESIRGAGVVTITTENRYVDLPIPGYEDTREGEYVVLTVSDTGVGIPPADIGRIFEPFYTRKVMGRSGTGLGLAVVWGTIKDHGGYIDVRSEEDKGSAFILYFPITREALSKEDPHLPLDTYSGRGESILVVDDIEEQRLLAVTILKDMNYRVAAAASGEDAVEYLQANKTDLIVLDMIMEPGIDGLETYRRILEIHPRQKAIIVSGFAKTDRVHAAQELGAGEYIKKPYVIEKIGIAVRNELDRK